MEYNLVKGTPPERKFGRRTGGEKFNIFSSLLAKVKDSPGEWFCFGVCECDEVRSKNSNTDADRDRDFIHKNFVGFTASVFTHEDDKVKRALWVIYDGSPPRSQYIHAKGTSTPPVAPPPPLGDIPGRVLESVLADEGVR
jgi:hypothetical protein